MFGKSKWIEVIDISYNRGFGCVLLVARWERKSLGEIAENIKWC
jgi:hypothetical protein